MPLTRRGVLAGSLAVAGVSLLGGKLFLRSHELVERARFGVRVGSEPYPGGYSSSTAARDALESELGHQLPIAVWFMNYAAPWNVEAAQALIDRGGYDILLCWETPGVRMADIIDGTLDEQFVALVRQASTYSGEVVIRLFHEPNGNWYDWAPGSESEFARTPAEYRRGWRHLVDLARSVGGPNIKFMFCANSEDHGPFSVEELYPGDEHVDIVGHDGYARGNQSFDALHSPMYRRLTSLNAGSDYYIGECGVAGGGTAEWFAGAYGSKQFPRLRAVCWFSVREFRIDLDPAAIPVHRRSLGRMRRER